jgi:hypothetical protein
VDTDDNELAYFESIHLFVEILDQYFGNVCELDLVFNFFKVGFVFFSVFFFFSFSILVSKRWGERETSNICFCFVLLGNLIFFSRAIFVSVIFFDFFFPARFCPIMLWKIFVHFCDTQEPSHIYPFIWKHAFSWVPNQSFDSCFCVSVFLIS